MEGQPGDSNQVGPKTTARKQLAPIAWRQAREGANGNQPATRHESSCLRTKCLILHAVLTGPGGHHCGHVGAAHAQRAHVSQPPSCHRSRRPLRGRRRTGGATCAGQPVMVTWELQDVKPKASCCYERKNVKPKQLFESKLVESKLDRKLKASATFSPIAGFVGVPVGGCGLRAAAGLRILVIDFTHLLSDV